MRAPAPETVMQRALREAAIWTEEDAEGYARWERAWFRDMAVSFLQDQGVKLLGDATLVEWAIDRATGDFEMAHRLSNENAQRRPGRPSNSLDVNRIYTAAFLAQDHGLSRRQQTLRAARMLGAPATKDRVEKGLRAYLRATAVMASCVPADREHRVFDFMIELVVGEKRRLLRIVDELANEKALTASRRYADRHATFFGAASGASLPDLKRETKQ